jgi:hypothetical protein
MMRVVYTMMRVAAFARYHGQCCKHPVDLDASFEVTLNVVPDDGRLMYLAAHPGDRRASFSGSMLPFPTESMAFEGTPNAGTLQISTFPITIRFAFPNSYYTGKTLIPPTLYLSYVRHGRKEITSIRLSDPTPFRDIAHPPTRTSVQFYPSANTYPVRSQYDILLSSAYSSARGGGHKFWGNKPAV